MRHDPDRLRPLEGSGPWLHKPRSDPRVKDAQKALRRWYAVIAVALVLALAAHVAPKAWGQYQHDLQEYQR